jgi:hypothetical protein
MTTNTDTTTTDLTVKTVIDNARQRGVVFVTTTDQTGTLTIKWSPPRAITSDEARILFRAGTTALAELLTTPDTVS